jgi:hypothetical protein
MFITEYLMSLSSMDNSLPISEKSFTGKALFKTAFLKQKNSCDEQYAKHFHPPLSRYLLTRSTNVIFPDP